MNYEELSLKGFINEIKEVSTGPHARKFCFVLGAGASISSGIKSGQELVDKWDEDLLERNREQHLKWKEELNINETNKYSFYSDFYERRFKRLSADGYNYLEQIMEHAKPGIGYVMLSYILTETENNVVVTTNFDHLTEDAVNYYTQKIPLIIGHESLAHYMSRQVTRPTIIKIHRDLLFDPKNKAEDLEKLHESWEKVLDIVFSEYNPIFIGYAGNDNSLMNFLIANSDKFLNNHWSFPYWMMYKKDTAQDKVIEFLQKSGGYLIKHDGFDEVLYRLGAAFEYKLPDKKDFLSDAEKRFQTLTNFIDDFTEKSVNKKETESMNRAEDETAEIQQAVQQITSQAEHQSLYRESMVLYNNGNYEEAAEIGKKLVGLDPENAKYHTILGNTLKKMNEYEEALLEAKKAIALEPEESIYHYNLGNTLFALKQYEEAIQAQKKAIELNPDDARYHNNLGIALRRMNRYEEALDETKKAIKLVGDYAMYHDNLGNCLYDMGRYEEALAQKQIAMELEPNNITYKNSYENMRKEIEDSKKIDKQEES